ncbi:rolling-circle replication initiation protein RepA [Haloterrigena jeotgali icosahedral virus 1]|uniref:Uncharacterized protein n=2 Tax=root TaxID=1 RepID=A0AAF0T3U4_9EURY|nr:hypothetical protein [Natrinema thermotolerans]YP_010772648.1 rolling-circle replication initiation protein RepA [Haloterrigena jeotgali icosahedral virus 1]QCC57412.1 hypothetical protein DVR14_01660 [Natrinema thermotolerans]WMT10383.1 hypothetical protein NP511_22735 [Natrinema thermotolerans]WPH65796.1 hypothetical protein HJIV1_gp5 [Haloterrigena jeotgali icosahedral virus 1]DAC85288.1 TPA_asm: rolling-circle replication initiation protein RepA [Haloterrigena jeotgali icosahedral virus
MTTDTDSNDDTELYSTVGPDIAASQEDREQAARIIDVIESLDTLTKEDIIDEYERKYPNTKTFNDERTTGGLEKKYRPAALDLPGFGEKRETCGKPIPHVCDCCGEMVKIGRTCSQSMCPRCAPKWVLKTAPGIVNNIMGAARMMSANNDYDAVYKHHAVLSPPEDLYIDAENPEQELISLAQEFMAEIDMQGIALYHPWTGQPTEDDEGDDAVLNEAEDFEQNHDDDIGEWKERLFEGRDWYGDVREELQHRPHIHLIGACPWFPGGDVTKLVNAETDWVIHRITGKREGNSPISLGGIRDVARAVVYALSHVAIDTREDGKGGDHNKYIYGKKGKEFLNADDRDLEEAKAKCNAVAPLLLGIEKMEASCREEIPEEETDHDSDPADEDALDDLEDDAETSSTDEDEISMATCHGNLVSIDRADFVDDEEWRSKALFADEAVRAKQEWEEKGGWEGWLERQTGQARLPTDGAESVDSPPPG